MAEPSMMQWTFVSECDIPSDVQELLVPGETPVAAYKTIRDTAVLTDKRPSCVMPKESPARR